MGMPRHRSRAANANSGSQIRIGSARRETAQGPITHCGESTEDARGDHAGWGHAPSRHWILHKVMNVEGSDEVVQITYDREDKKLSERDRQG